MTPDLFDTAIGALRLALLFTVGLFLPLLLQLSLLFFVAWVFKELVPRVSIIATSLLSLVGVPIHEFSHAIGDLITFVGVAAIKPLIVDQHGAFSIPRRPHFLGNIVSTLAPMFGGILVLWLTAVYVIPGLEATAATLPELDLEAAASFETVIRESMGYLEYFVRAAYDNLTDLQWASWRTYVGLYIALSVGIGLAPSSQDLRILLRSLPLAFIFVFGLFVWLYLSGDAESRFLTLQEGIVPHLLKFSTAATYAFMLTTLGVFVFLPLRIWQRLRVG